MLSLEDKHRCLKHLNFALIRTLPYLATQSQNEFYTYDAQLNPTEYYAGMPVPRLFEEGDIFERIDAIASQFVASELVQIADKLDQIEERLSNELSSPNHALMKADDLQWDVSLRSRGMELRRGELIERLRYYLKLPPTPPIMGGALGRS